MASAAAVGAAPAPPTELHKLIRERDWSAAIERCRSNPQEVGSAPHHRDERGYTPLHALVAYNQTVPGEVLVPVIEAILRAADDINFGEEYRLGVGEGLQLDEDGVNTNEIIEPRGGRGEETSMGSWRLLLDQNNRAQWSPLHLMFVQGGIKYGKIAVMKALLRINEGHNVVGAYQYRKLLSLSDRQNRNVVHHIVGCLVPHHDDVEIIRLLAVAEADAPSLFVQQDCEGHRPLDLVLGRLTSNPGTRRRHYLNNYGGDEEGPKKNYEMLSVLIRCMADGHPAVHTTKNTLQRACLLSKQCCSLPLVKFLCSSDASRMEKEMGRNGREGHARRQMAIELDENGNQALHLLVSNDSFCSDAGIEYSAMLENLMSTGPEELHLFRALQIAMTTGIRPAIAPLAIAHPKGVLLDERLEDMKLFVHALGCIAKHGKLDCVENLEAVFFLIRSRPGIISLSGRSEPEANDVRRKSKETKWWKKLHPFL